MPSLPPSKMNNNNNLDLPSHRATHDFIAANAAHLMISLTKQPHGVVPPAIHSIQPPPASASGAPFFSVFCFCAEKMHMTQPQCC
mmetsp:Transcript_23173/g.64427  ORF Transcript_23173/g.64427 Transcript_23173/m.64427 type:complete len:85 (+) Transcript_23173:156-410(+)